MQGNHKAGPLEFKKAGSSGKKHLHEKCQVVYTPYRQHYSLTKGAELGGDLGHIEGFLLAWKAQGLFKIQRYLSCLAVQVLSLVPPHISLCRHAQLAESIHALISQFPHDVRLPVSECVLLMHRCTACYAESKR